MKSQIGLYINEGWNVIWRLSSIIFRWYWIGTHILTLNTVGLSIVLSACMHTVTRVQQGKNVLIWVQRKSMNPLMRYLQLQRAPKKLPVSSQCPKPPDQPRDAARREECSDLEEKSLTTFCRWDGRVKGSDGDHLNDFMRLKWTTQNDALVEDSQQEYPKIRQDHDVAACPIPGTYVELQDLQFNAVWHDVAIRHLRICRGQTSIVWP